MSKTQLEISFYGPYVFELLQNKLTVTAPRCPGHLASVQTDTDEKALLGCGPDKQTPYHYALQPADKGSQRSNPSHTTCANPGQIILVESWRKLATPAGKDYHFQLDLPRPNDMLGLIADPISYVEYDLPQPPSTTGLKATAMRFYYTGFDESDLNLVVLAGVKPGDIITRVKMSPCPPQTHVPITFRYTSNSIFDSDHDDAEECFMRMRSIFPGLGSWTADFDFENKKKRFFQTIEGTQERLGGDCKAAAIMFVPLDEKKEWLPGKVHEPPPKK